MSEEEEELFDDSEIENCFSTSDSECDDDDDDRPIATGWLKGGRRFAAVFCSPKIAALASYPVVRRGGVRPAMK